MRVIQFTRGNWTSEQMIAAFTERDLSGRPPADE